MADWQIALTLSLASTYYAIVHHSRAHASKSDAADRDLRKTSTVQSDTDAERV